MSDPPAPPAAPDLFGHPRGLAYLSMTEVWERFSFYGMQALLILYMVDELLTPGHIERVWGFAALRSGLEGMFGPLSPVATAAQVAGLYGGFIYVTPILGGWIGDRWLGQRRTVMLGAALMAAGHLLMAFEPSFLVALLLLIAGGGALKGNIAAQVGELYPAGDGRRDAGFVIFNLAINIGVFVAPFVCGTLGERLGWHYGFGAAAAGMAVGLVTYAIGKPYIPAGRPRGRDARGPKLSRDERRTIGGILAVLGIGAFYSAAYFQTFGVMTLWIREHVDRGIGGFTVPATWFLSLGGLCIILLSPLMLRLWRAQAARGREPGDLAKIGWGGAMGVVAYALLALAATAERASMIWVVAFFVIATLGFLWYWPLTLAIVSKTSPRSVRSTMMGIAYLALAIGNNMVGLVGQYYDRMSPSAFWGLQAAISAVTALLVLAFGRRLSRSLGLR